MTVECPECGELVHRSGVCPNCGRLSTDDHTRPVIGANLLIRNASWCKKVYVLGEAPVPIGRAEQGNVLVLRFDVGDEQQALGQAQRTLRLSRYQGRLQLFRGFGPRYLEHAGTSWLDGQRLDPGQEVLLQQGQHLLLGGEYELTVVRASCDHGVLLLPDERLLMFGRLVLTSGPRGPEFSPLPSEGRLDNPLDREPRIVLGLASNTFEVWCKHRPDSPFSRRQPTIGESLELLGFEVVLVKHLYGASLGTKDSHITRPVRKR